MQRACPDLSIRANMPTPTPDKPEDKTKARQPCNCALSSPRCPDPESNQGHVDFQSGHNSRRSPGWLPGFSSTVMAAGLVLVLVAVGPMRRTSGVAGLV